MSDGRFCGVYSVPGRAGYRAGPLTVYARARLCGPPVQARPLARAAADLGPVAPSLPRAPTLTGKGLHQDTLRVMLDAGAVRDVQVKPAGQKLDLGGASGRCRQLVAAGALTPRSFCAPGRV